MRIRTKLFSIACSIALTGLLMGCGTSTTNTQTQVTGLTKRVLLTNRATGTMSLLDGQKDAFSTKSVSAGAGAAKLVTGSGITVVQDTGSNTIVIFDNTKEAVTFAPATSAIPFDVAISPDGKTAWAAMRNPGFVQAFDVASGNVLASIPVPNAVRLVMSPQGRRLLVFVDNPQLLAAPNKNAFFVISTANVSGSTTATAVTGTGLDQPYTALFNGNDNQAFILNCGAECGGTTASVMTADFSGATPVLGTPVAVAGATVGLVNGQSLFVAGTPPTLPTGLTCPATLGTCGTLQVINTGTLTAGAPLAITDGLHQKMAFTSNNHLYVGAARCTTVASGTNQVRGCLSIFDAGSQGLVFPSESSFRQNFDVTGLQPISARNVIYVVQGGELDFFDITTSAVATSITPIDVQGLAFDVLQIDP